MSGKKVTILGGGNTAFSVAAQLSHMGNEICLLEHPSFAQSVEQIARVKEIDLDGVMEKGPAPISKVTLDPKEAFDFSNTVLLIVPAYAHRPFAEFCGPYLTKNHTVLIMPGTLGAMEFSALAAEFGVSDITVGEVDTAPYVCRKTSEAGAIIWGEVTALGLGVLPAFKTDDVANQVRALFPGIIPYKDVMECGLSSMNPVVHPAGVLMNAGRVEYSRGEFYFYEEGVSSSVAMVIEKVDSERLAIGSALGYDLTPVGQAFHDAGFGPKGSIWEAINGSHMLTRLKAPGSLDSRWLTEDIPYGIAAWSKIGKQFGIDTPIIDSIVDLGSVVMGFDGWTGGRGPVEFGISGMSKEALKQYLETGEA